MFYIPFSILGGLGMVGLMNGVPFVGMRRSLSVLLIFCAIGVNLFLNKSIYPDSCCEYFNGNDQNAFSWIQKNTPDKSLFLISSFVTNGQMIGTDAGIWLSPLTGRSTNRLPYALNWADPAQDEAICASGARDIYIYVGGKEFSFVENPLNDGKISQRIYSYGSTAIYRFLACKK